MKEVSEETLIETKREEGGSPDRSIEAAPRTIEAAPRASGEGEILDVRIEALTEPITGRFDRKARGKNNHAVKIVNPTHREEKLIDEITKHLKLINRSQKEIKRSVYAVKMALFKLSRCANFPVSGAVEEARGLDLLFQGTGEAST